ncbi:MAG: hypothetical protein AAFV53_30580 [Myxococcota bacterium]
MYAKPHRVNAFTLATISAPHPKITHIAPVSFLVFIFGCLDGAIDETYPGVELGALSGNVLLEKELKNTSDLKITLFWQRLGAQGQATQRELRAETEWPATYEMVFYQPPPEDAYISTPTGDAVAYAYPMLYLDLDGDGRWEREPVVGGTREVFVQHSPDTLLSPSGTVVFDPGYNAIVAAECGQEGRPPLPAPGPADAAVLVIRDEFEQFLPDFNCDGELLEWEGLCAGGCDEDGPPQDGPPPKPEDDQN